MTKTQHFLFLLVEEHTHLALSCAIDPLRIANLIAGEELYRWSFASTNGHSSTASNGIVSMVNYGLDSLPPSDRLFVLSGINMRQHISHPLIAALRRERARGARIGGLCSAAWVLAEAGFLDGQRAAIHWDYHDSFGEAFHNIELVRGVFVADAKCITAAGGTATADLMLNLIEQDHGEDLALSVSDQMLYNAARDGDARQKTSLQARNGMRNAHLVRALKMMQDTIEAPLPPAQIAREIGISTRQLERLFGKYLSTSPKKHFMEMRLERARHLLLQTEASVTDVALACGFESPGHFSRVYRSSFGVAPSMQRAKMN